MKHQPFEDWLLSGEPLEPAAQASLTAHLQACETCRGLWEDLGRVDALLHGAAMARPAPDFRIRWSAHQERDPMRRKWNQGWRLLAAAMAGSVVLCATLGAAYLIAGGSPAVVFASIFQQAIRLSLWLRVVGEIGRALVWNLPLVGVSGYALFLTAMMTATGLLAVAWSATFRRFSQKGALK